MGRVFPGYRNKLYQVEVRDGIRVIRLLTYVTANKGVFKRTLNYVFYMVMTIFCVYYLLPLYVMLTNSLKPLSEITAGGMMAPRQPTTAAASRWPAATAASGAAHMRRAAR